MVRMTVVTHFIKIVITGKYINNAKKKDKEKIKKKRIGAEVETIHPNPGN